MELFALNDKTAIVTGALGLLGRKHCEALAEAGAQVVVADLDGEAAGEFADRLGTQHLGIGLDVTDKASVQEAAQQIIQRFGKNRHPGE